MNNLQIISFNGKFASHHENSNVSLFTKYISFMTLEVDTLLQIQKWWHTIISPLCQYLSTNKICPPYKTLRAEHHNTAFSFLPLDTHPKFPTAKVIYEAFSRALRVDPVKDNTISSSKASKSYVKIITYMNNENLFDSLIVVVFVMSP